MKKTVYFDKSTDEPVITMSKILRDKDGRFLVAVHESEKSKVYVLTVTDYLAKQTRTEYGVPDPTGQRIVYDISMKNCRVHAVSNPNKIAVTFY